MLLFTPVTQKILLMAHSLIRSLSPPYSFHQLSPVISMGTAYTVSLNVPVNVWVLAIDLWLTLGPYTETSVWYSTYFFLK